MGVHGLWRLIDPSGRPVPLETLENKILAVDISIWLHQCVKGFQDSKGASVPNAHLLGIYHRLCKLLYFKIKPVFVFDGGVPALKRQTIAKRTQSKLKNVAQADKLQKQLLSVLLKHTAVSKVLTEKIEASIGAVHKPPPSKVENNMFMLPDNPELDSTLSESEDDSVSETTSESSPGKYWDLHTIDVNSEQFKSLPPDVRHEILTDLKETRKQSSWGKLHELPKVSDDFSVYQMKRLLKRQAVQVALEDIEKEMGGKALSIGELESLLKDQGVIPNENVGNRIASDNITKYLLVKDIKQAIVDSKQNVDSLKETVLENSVKEVDSPKDVENKADKEYEEDLQRAIALSLEAEVEETQVDDGPSTSKKTNKGKLKPSEFSFLENFTDADFASSSSEEEQEENNIAKTKLASVQGYMLEYSGLTPIEIKKIMNMNVEKKSQIIKKDLPVICESETITATSNGNSEKQQVQKEELVLMENGKKCDYDENKRSEVVDGEVEFMSCSDSSDDDSSTPKEVINVVIDPEDQFKEEDDLFSDIFSETVGKPAVESKTAQNSDVSGNSKSQKVLSVATNPSDGCIKDDDSFSDAFDKEGDVENVNANVSVTKAKESEEECFKVPLEKQNKVAVDRTVNESKVVNLQNENSAENVRLIKEVEEKTLTNETERKKEVDIQKVEEGDKSNVVNAIGEHGGNKSALSEQELVELKTSLQREKVDILSEKSSKERLAGNITDQMYQEAQELLELFGVPYIVAPMEAEAQCAFLDEINLTSGTITDDSDIWLFGGKTVYKNFFNQSKYVMEFRVDDIQHNFKLTRQQMILLALLVGSDYTVGIQGIGPVTAMEILSTFPPTKGNINEINLTHFELLSGLKEFRSWFIKGKSPGPGRNALKSKLKNIIFTENFPSLQVVQAYLEPSVETSKETFSWGKPNVPELMEYAREKFGWTLTKTEEILNPVMKRLEEARHQKSIKDYFKTTFKLRSGGMEDKISKRVKSAINNMGRDPSEIIVEELERELKKEQKKKPIKKKQCTEAPEFSKKKSSSKKSNKAQQENHGEDVSERKSKRTSTTERSKPVNLKKLKVTPEKNNESCDGTTNNENNQEENLPVNNSSDISEKINLIRRRRKLKEAKAAVNIKPPKVKKDASRQPKENIPEGLEGDDEVNLLSHIFEESTQKVKEIGESIQNKINNLLQKTNQVPTQSTSRGSKSVTRPTRIPRKEVIPQKEKDKSTVLRNKLKAIETFRKSKRGPGYVPKRGRKNRLPKDDAELSEDSSD